jgi:hypothetical protein
MSIQAVVPVSMGRSWVLSAAKAVLENMVKLAAITVNNNVRLEILFGFGCASTLLDIAFPSVFLLSGFVFFLKGDFE